MKTKQIITYQPSPFVTIPLPYRNPKVDVWRKTYNCYTLSLYDTYDEGLNKGEKKSQGLPYSRYGRLALSLLVTKALQSGRADVEMGKITDVLRHFSLPLTGKAINTLTTQLFKISETSVRFTYSGEVAKGVQGLIHEKMNLVKKIELFWGTKGKQLSLFENKITLSPDFSKYIEEHSIPVDLKTYVSIQSPLGQDIYAWLCKRFYSLRTSLNISWEALYWQFGPVKPTSRPRFREHFIKEVSGIVQLYPEARISIHAKNGVELRPSPTHIRHEGRIPSVVADRRNYTENH